MSRESRNRRALIGFVVCLVLGIGSVLAMGGLSKLLEAAESGPGQLLAVSVIVLLVGLSTSMWIFLPYGFIALGWLRLGDYRKHELKEMPEDNTVGDPVEGERKYQQWLSAMNSTEAYLGMIPRSEPYVPPELRPPKDAGRTYSRLSKQGWSILTGVLTAGALLGAALGYQRGLGANGHIGGFVQILTAGLVGLVLSFPIAVALGLLFGRVEDVKKEEDDARRSGSETT